MSKPKVLITGGTGLIGHALINTLTRSGYNCNVLTRSPSQANHYKWDLENGSIELKAFEDVKVIIHLAGASISDKRWTKKRKKLLVDSRTQGPDLLFQTIIKHKIEINQFISASGINIYSFDNPEEVKREESVAGKDFIHQCVVEWEASIDQFDSICHVSKLRTGLVLSKNGGALKTIEKPIKYFLGAPLGSGQQWVPWVHIDDVCRAYLHLVENPLSGTYNLVADEGINNKSMTKKIAEKLKRPVLPFGVPTWLLKLILGEMAVLVLKGYRASSSKLIQTGFDFDYSSFDEALIDLYEN